MEAKQFEFRDLYIKHRFEENQTVFFSLWHYTSVDGLLGIVRNKAEEHGKLHFWFTRSDCLNDTSEGKHVLNMFEQICSDLLKHNEIDKVFYDILKKIEISAHQLVNFPIPSSEENFHQSVVEVAPCDAYICSFSLKEDSLDMWRYYSKGKGGYGLKFAPFLFDEYKEYEISDYQENATFSMLRSYKVIYDNTQKVEILRELITDTFLAYKNSKETDEQKEKNIKNFIQYALKVFQFQFKHECYESEQEYRFVFYRPYSKPKLLQNKLPTIKFRSQSGMLVPYIDIVVEKGNSFLKEVLISPYIENENMLTTTSDYLFECGFNCTTKLSQLPVRK